MAQPTESSDDPCVCPRMTVILTEDKHSRFPYGEIQTQFIVLLHHINHYRDTHLHGTQLSGVKKYDIPQVRHAPSGLRDEEEWRPVQRKREEGIVQIHLSQLPPALPILLFIPTPVPPFCTSNTENKESLTGEKNVEQTSFIDNKVARLQEAINAAADENLSPI